MTDLPPTTMIEEMLREEDHALLQAWHRERRAIGVSESEFADTTIGSTVGQRVTLPGQASTVGAGARRARRRADTVGDPVGTRHSWVPVGPRNVAGRTKALAIDLGNTAIAYAGCATGGVWKTIDGGDSWFPLWHDEPSQSVVALSICAADSQVIWAATGEVQTGEQGDGVWRSDDAGATWANPAVPHVPGSAADPANQFEAIAAHPTSRTTAWAVGPAGIFRTVDSGAHWAQFRPGEYWSDVAISGAFVYLVCARTFAGESTVVRLALAATDAVIRGALPDDITLPPTAPVASHPIPGVGANPPRPGRGKIAIASAAPELAYVHFVATTGGDFEHAGVFRCNNAAAAADGAHMNWRPLATGPAMNGQGQGDHNLTMAVTPDGRSIAMALVDMFLCRRADTAAGLNPANFLLVAATDIDIIEPTQHADHHVSLFAPLPGGGAMALWDVNDGGIGQSINWADPNRTGVAANPVLPIPPNRVTFRRRDDGIVSAQMYDLAQSPLVSGLIGCGFQDNGVLISSGGGTWMSVIGADGGHVAFDPDDPYTFVATWQSGIGELHVPGVLDEALFAPGASQWDATWPRTLQAGFSIIDGAPFVAETVHDTRRSRRVYTGRAQVMYSRGVTSGDRWTPEKIGAVFELRRIGVGPSDEIEVLATAGGAKLGLVAQRVRVDAAVPIIRIPALAIGPYALTSGDTLRLRIGGALRTITFTNGALIPDVTKATATQVVAAINAVVAGLAQEVTRTTAIFVQLIAVSTATPVTLTGSALANLNAPAGARTAVAGRNAVACVLPFDMANNLDFVDLTGTSLRVDVGGTAVTVDFDDLADPAHAGRIEVARLLRARLDPTVVTVGFGRARRRLRLVSTTATPLQVTGSARRRLSFATGAALTNVSRDAELIDMTTAAPPDLVLTIATGAKTRSITFNAAVGLLDRSRTTFEELREVIMASLAAGANPPDVRVEVEYQPIGFNPRVTEIVPAPSDPEIIWVGDTSGRVFRRNPAGPDEWVVAGAAQPFNDRWRVVEAIAVHPQDPQQAIVGLSGRAANADDHPFVYRTTDGGDHWEHVGTDLHDSAGLLVGADGMEVDPDRPGVVWAATPIGVFRSADFGTSWQPFNEGLPNVFMQDLAYDRAGQVLKVGAWGRGVWERPVGAQPVHDVRLVLRASVLDDGTRPVRRGPDPLSIPPRAAALSSPDIKNTRRLAFASPPYTDGVTFDRDLRHEPPTPGEAVVAVQVQNRAPFPTTAPRVTAAWAHLVDGLVPDLTADFFTQYRAGTIASDTTIGPWTVIGDGPLPSGGAGHDIVTALVPRVRLFPYRWPDTVDDAGAIAIVAIAHSDDDEFTRSDTAIDRLTAADSKVACRESPTVRAADDARIVLRSTNGVPITMSNPTVGNPATALGFALGGAAASSAASGSAPFNLNTGAPRGFAIRQVRTVAVRLGASPDLPAPAAATGAQIARVMRRDLLGDNVPIRADTNGAGRIRLRSVGAVRFSIQASAGATALGLAAGGPVTTIVGGPAPYNVSAADLQVLIDVEVGVDVRFPRSTVAAPDGTPEIAALATAQAHEVRAAIERQVRHSGLAVAVEAVHRQLVVRRSVTDSVGASARLGRTGGAQYADLVVNGTAVPADADRRALFRLPTVRGVDRAQRSHTNHVYVRIANAGNVPTAAVRCRFWAIDPDASPLPSGAPSAAAPGAIAPGADAVVAFTWDPGALAVGTRRLLLVVADEDVDGQRLEPDAEFATADALDAFCRANPNAALREIEIS